MILEADPAQVVSRVAIRAEDSNINFGEQTVAQAGLAVSINWYFCLKATQEFWRGYGILYLRLIWCLRCSFIKSCKVMFAVKIKLPFWLFWFAKVFLFSLQ